jgi:MFS family permease
MSAIDQLIGEITRYFAGERSEMIAFLIYAGALLIVAVVLFWTGDRFGRALSGCLVVASLIAVSTAVPLLRRDGPLRDALVAAVQTDGARPAVAVERARMDAVLANYPRYRYAFVASALVGLGLLLFTHGATSRGVTVGLLIIAATGVVVDQFSEARAERYRAALGALVA